MGALEGTYTWVVGWCWGLGVEIHMIWAASGTTTAI